MSSSSSVLLEQDFPISPRTKTLYLCVNTLYNISRFAIQKVKAEKANLPLWMHGLEKTCVLCQCLLKHGGQTSALSHCNKHSLGTPRQPSQKLAVIGQRALAS